MGGGRRSSMRVSYQIETPFGDRLELLDRQSGLLSLVAGLDQQAKAGGAQWRPDTHRQNGRILYDRECVEQLTSHASPSDLVRLRTVLRLDQFNR